MTQTIEQTNVWEVILSQDGLQNPYPFYQELRTQDPVHWNAASFSWMLTRYDDVMAVLQDSRFSSDWPTSFAYARPLDENEQAIFNRLIRYFSMWVLSNDAPKHTRMRALIQKAFTPRSMQRMQGQIEQIVDELLRSVEPKGQMEVVADLAKALPSIVIARLMGLPDESRRHQFNQWIGSASAFIASPFPAPGLLEQVERDVEEVHNLFRPLVAERREKPGEDLISDLLRGEGEADVIVEEEIVANCFLLLLAGYETTQNLISNGLLALFRNPDQFTKLKANLQADPADTTLLKGAVEEFLRYDSPLQWQPRQVIEDLEFRGKQFQKGQTVFIGLGAANHDPAKFEDPDKLNIERQENRNLGFGYGPHYCLGAALARMEGQAAFRAMLTRLEGLELVSESVEWVPSMGFRELKSLPVRFQAVN